MKNFRLSLLWLPVLAVFLGPVLGQKTVTKTITKVIVVSKPPKLKDTTATRQWVRDYFSALVKSTITAPITIPVIPPSLPETSDNRPDCATGLDLLSVSASSNDIRFRFQAVDVQSIEYHISKDGAVLLTGTTGQLTGPDCSIPKALPAGTYQLQIKAVNCKSNSASGIRVVRRI